MALNIDIVNSTIINVYDTGGIARSYFGATGASGKFYPSGTSGGFVAGNDINFTLMSNTLSGVADNNYTSVPTTTSGSGVGLLFGIDISTNLVDAFFVDGTIASGYGIGDTVTVQGSDLGGGSGELVFKVISLDIDGLLIVVGGDFYSTKWNNLVVGGTSPTSLSDAQSLLATLFSTL
jgi:hypothetical protein